MQYIVKFKTNLDILKIKFYIWLPLGLKLKKVEFEEIIYFYAESAKAKL